MILRRRGTGPKPRLPDGERVYAIGDIHGEAVLLQRLLAMIHEDDAQRGTSKTTLVLLGDVIDRGKAAASLLLGLMDMADPHLVILKGNHEAALVNCYRGRETIVGWLHFGGVATLEGFGVAQNDIFLSDNEGRLATLRASVDPKIIDWLDRLPLSWSSGDYFFTHAGVRPGVPLDRQTPEDLLWIRQPFLSSRADHGKIIVHGHTIEPGVPRLGGNRIGLDTGAHEHGRLTALGLEGEEQWLLQAEGLATVEFDAAPQTV